MNKLIIPGLMLLTVANLAFAEQTGSTGNNATNHTPNIAMQSEQDKQGVPSVYDFDIRHWTSNDGLSSNSVRAVTQDELGYLWLGTLYGLNRFDGLQFEHFTSDNTRHLASNTITRLLMDNTGYIWVGTKAGLSGLDPTTLKFERYPIVAEVTAIISIADDEVWVAADNLFRIKAGKISRIEAVRSQVHQLEKAPEGIWVSTAEHLYQLSPDGSQQRHAYPLPLELAQTPVYDLTVTEQGLHLASESGFYHLSPEGEILKCQLPDGEHSAVYRLFKDSQQGSWISTYRKLFYRQHRQEWQTVTTAELGTTPWFSDVFEDKQQNIWLASYSDGIYRAAAGHVRRLVDGLADPVVRSVGLTPDDELIIASQSALQTLNKSGEFTTLLGAEIMGSQTIHDFFWPESQLLWFGADSGLLQYNLKTRELSVPFPSLQGNTIKVVQPAVDGGVWLGGVRGLYYSSDKQLTLSPLNEQFESRNITALQHKTDQLFVGTTRGLYQYQQDKLQRLGVGNALYNSYILALLHLPDGSLLVSTIDDGIFIRRPEQQWLQLHTGNGMPHGPAVSFSYDEVDQQVWVSSHKGIYRLALATLPESSNQPFIIDEVLTPFDRQLGSGPNRCCNGAGHAKIVQWQDEYWFPTLKGLIAVQANLKQTSEQPLKPQIKQVTTSQQYQLTQGQQQLVLEMDERNVRLHYSALEYIKPDALQFRYRLEGFDSHWHEVSQRREAVYTNLPPGDFIFRLQVRQAGHSWQSASETSLELIVPERFDETLLYRSLWLLLLLCCLYGVLWLVRRNTLHKQLELERLVRQRTQELENSNVRLNELNEQLGQLTHKDNLTGLRNRRFMFEQLPKDIEHFQRNRELMQDQGKCLALLHVDLDNFKQINDQYGNSAGDSLIQQVSGLLIRETRGSDYVVRFSGAAFVLVLRDIQADLVRQFSYRLNEQVAKAAFNLPDGQTVRLTCSIGYAHYPLPLLGGQLINWEVSLQLAELALYHVKHHGKNAVATLEFDSQLDAFEFEDSAHIEAQIEKLLAEGLVWFEQGDSQAL
ncbi:MAG: GGDEF domain-containing protein [Rheinheimera sp.]|uniref:ligand-binding sensor domain-containing protein n=1 Tax=Arsukibacterium sp. UBA3155 TaxID=1946058 RepID=UPI000C928D99|nr:ligand-binding sensor domain-containing diguanylate cyclase [Arsukibacterium sp. UBA3155]MAD77179.1 GGDEF domain-containing protein [Rheinheimera sp.]|tara:strand:+ start:46097 stop:49219 length:3123 start_codon:yes stop_codon:yes gene_type:complete